MCREHDGVEVVKLWNYLGLYVTKLKESTGTGRLILFVILLIHSSSIHSMGHILQI